MIATVISTVIATVIAIATTRVIAKMVAAAKVREITIEKTSVKTRLLVTVRATKIPQAEPTVIAIAQLLITPHTQQRM